MSWARLDDRFWSNRKVMRAWRRSRPSIGLHVMGMSYCAQHETDGAVDAEWVEDRLPAATERRKTLDVLVEVGLWERDGDDFRIHDWLDFNPSHAEAEERRRRDADRKARGRTGDVRDLSARTTNGRSVDASRALPHPDPTRPIPDPPGPPPGGNRKRDQERWRSKAATWARAVGFDGKDSTLAGAVKGAEVWKHDDPASRFGEWVAERHAHRAAANA